MLDIIKKLQDKDRPQYHTCFPAGVLSEEFLLRAFKRAVMTHFLMPKGGLDLVNNLFYVDYQGYKIAGYFIADGDHFHIKTAFPDLSWHYRIHFQHQINDDCLARYLKLEPVYKRRVLDGHIWLGEIATEDEHREFEWSTLLYPETVKKKRVQKTSKINPEDFITVETIAEIVKQSYALANNEFVVDDVLALFFHDPAAPTEQEVSGYFAFVKAFFPSLTFDRKKNTLARRVLLSKRPIKNHAKSCGIRGFYFSKEFGFEHLSADLKSLGISAGDAIVRSMLELHMIADLVDDDISNVLPPTWKTVSKNFHDRLVNRLLQDPEHVKTFVDAGLGLTATTIFGKGKVNRWGISLYRKTDVTLDGIGELLDFNYKLILTVLRTTTESLTFKYSTAVADGVR